MNKKLPDSFGKERLYNEYFEEQQDKVILWEDTCPKEFEVKCESDEGYLSVYNIFEELDWTGKKRRNSQMPYSGMILEQSGNTYRYSCNNAKLNSEFDKFVFEIELLDD